VVIVKKEVWLPPAQGAVQLVQSLQVPVQLMGQGVGLVQLVVDLFCNNKMTKKLTRSQVE
jgi:hypothetical protein